MRRTPALIAGALLAATTLGAPAAFADGGRHDRSVKHLVIIYEENHSFDNLYADWGRVGHDLPAGRHDPVYAAHSTQVDQHGNRIGCLLQVDANLSTTSQKHYLIDEPTKSTATPPVAIPPTHPGPLTPVCQGTLPNPASAASAAYDSAFTTSAPFRLQRYIKASDTTCAPVGKRAPEDGVLKTDPQGVAGGCTRDIVHRFYQEQYQLDDGRMDRYPTGSDAAGLTQGYYDTRSLPVWKYLHGRHAPNYVVADHFFQAAFGGSFLNHQYLVAARAPEYVGDPGTRNSKLDAAGFPNAGYPLYAPQPGATYADGPLTKACSPTTPPKAGANGLPVDTDGLACGNFAVNTMQPPWAPTAGGANVLPAINDSNPRAPGYQLNIGDRLSAAGVSWNWYAGGWDNAAGNTGGPGYTTGLTDPLFQYHHQPLNYFSAYAPGQPGRAHLQDEAAFLQAVDRGRLPSVSFVKPIGAENEHPGYASTSRGESHLVDLLRRIDAGPDARNTVVLVTYDEFGGQWDHVTPPGQGSNTAGPSDQYGPGTRIPALVIGRPLRRSGVDRTSYDTTSVLATIERTYGLAPLTTRDAQVADLMRTMRLERRHRD